MTWSSIIRSTRALSEIITLVTMEINLHEWLLYPLLSAHIYGLNSSKRRYCPNWEICDHELTYRTRENVWKFPKLLILLAFILIKVDLWPCNLKDSQIFLLKVLEGYCSGLISISNSEFLLHLYWVLHLSLLNLPMFRCKSLWMILYCNPLDSIRGTTYVIILTV